MDAVGVGDVNGTLDDYHRHVELEGEEEEVLNAEDDVEAGVAGGVGSYTHSCSCSEVGDGTSICRRKTSRLVKEGQKRSLVVC